MRLSSSKEVMILVRQAESQGWVISQTKKNHIKWTAPSGAIVYSGGTLSDFRAVNNIKRELRRFGFIEIQPIKKGKRK